MSTSNVPTFKLKKSILETPEGVRKFLKVFGDDEYHRVLRDVALRVGGNGRFGGLTQSEISKLSEDEYEKHRDAIMSDMAKLQDFKQDFEIDVRYKSDILTDPTRAQEVLELVGHDGYMQARGLKGLETLNLQALQKLNPNIQPNVRYSQGPTKKVEIKDA